MPLVFSAIIFATSMKVTPPAPLLKGFARQWSSLLKPFGFTQVSNLFLESYSHLSPAMTHGEAMFIIHVMQFKWTESAPFPSYSTLADRMGVTEISIKRYARSLESKGYLRRAKRRGKTNQLHLSGLIEQLDKLAESGGNFPEIE